MIKYKFPNIVLSFAIFLFAISPQIQAASFSDVSEDNKNYDAIEYLRENDVIEGYADGSFKPDQLVNRAEFLKIIIEGSNISPTIISDTPFPDVDHDAWYGPYLKHAYHKNWIQGYTDGTFKPEQTINKVEALKIVAKVQDWEIDNDLNQSPFNDTPSGEWYIPYVTYAKERGYLEETGSLLFPATVMTRANISEIIYRTLVTEDEENTITEEEDPDEQTQASDNETPVQFSAVNFKMIGTTFYDDITLDSTFPNTFYVDEVYMFEGSISNNFSEAAVILEGLSEDSYRAVSTDVSSGRFSIPVHFKQAGNYNLGILAGESGTTKAVKISVLSDLPESTDSEAFPPQASDLNADYEDDQTKIAFTASNDTLKKLVFEQGNDSVTYYSRQDEDEIIVDYVDFEDFSEGTVSYYLEVAALSSKAPLEITSNFRKSSTESFKAAVHTFKQLESEYVTADPPETLRANQDITFSGTLKANARLLAYAITPDGSVESFDLETNSPTSTYFNTEIIEEGGTFTFDYNPSESGRYIIEVNRENGEPMINMPVYIGNSLPLIPDFFDLNQRAFFTGSISINRDRNNFLKLINEARAESGAGAVALNEDLNNLAQAHSDDMADRNFFAHVNPDNETPEDRRIAAGLSTAVSENIAKDVSLESAHYGLLRSASHRENILNPNWETVGIGITEDNGHLIVAQEFSTAEITTADLEDFKEELIDEINDLRSDNGLNQLTENSNVEAASSYLNDKVLNEGETLTNELFLEALQENNVTGSAEAVGRNYNIWSTILESILDESSIVESHWQEIGADIQLDDTGIIHTILILSNP